MGYSETYRGHLIEVINDHPGQALVLQHYNTYGVRPLPCVTVAQARRGIDHRLDRSCRAHGVCSADSLPELRQHGVYAGVEGRG